jgi:hypothetical protein
MMARQQQIIRAVIQGQQYQKQATSNAAIFIVMAGQWRPTEGLPVLYGIIRRVQPAAHVMVHQHQALP